MAHFAELDENNIVKRVVVVGNDIPTSNGPLGDNDMHIDGETWCTNFFKGGTWKQTSYSNNFRKQYAGIGFKYDSTKNKFIAPQPYASWSLDSNDDWQAPITYPTITTYDSTWTQEEIDAELASEDSSMPEGTTAGDPKTRYYIINWDESAYQADNTTGWKATKHDNSVVNWNGAAWIAS